MNTYTYAQRLKEELGQGAVSPYTTGCSTAVDSANPCYSILLAENYFYKFGFYKS